MRSEVVVTGAGGFIGSHLCERLVAEGCRVIGVDRRHDSRATENLTGLAAEPRFALVEADLGRGLSASVLADAATIFHLAACPGARGSNVAAYIADNVTATARLLSDAGASGCRELVFASSSSVYGITGTGSSGEDDVPAPASVYARTKLLGENICRRAAVASSVVRLFTVYGPRQRPDMAFARFISSALGAPAPLYGGETDPVRDFTYVDDAVDGLVRAWLYGQPRRVYNISGGMPIELARARAELSRILGRPLHCLPGRSAVPEPLRTQADLTRARTELGYLPRVSLEDGLREQVRAATPWSSPQPRASVV